MRRVFLLITLGAVAWVLAMHASPPKGPVNGSAAYQQCIKDGIGTPEGCRGLAEP